MITFSKTIPSCFDANEPLTEEHFLLDLKGSLTGGVPLYCCTHIHTLATVLNTWYGRVTSPVCGGGKVEALVCFFPLALGVERSSSSSARWWDSSPASLPVPEVLSTRLSIAGRGLSSDSDDASLSTLDDDDDDLSEAMLPDQSQPPHSQSHTPLLTPHCIAGTV